MARLLIKRSLKVGKLVPGTLNVNNYSAIALNPINVITGPSFRFGARAVGLKVKIVAASEHHLWTRIKTSLIKKKKKTLPLEYTKASS